jgi:hypothetical protein
MPDRAIDPAELRRLMVAIADETRACLAASAACMERSRALLRAARPTRHLAVPALPAVDRATLTPTPDRRRHGPQEADSSGADHTTYP